MPVDIAKLRIVLYPAPVLRAPAREVDPADADVRAVAVRMLELMHAAPGVGLAAPQVGLPWRLFVANDTGDPGDDRVFINPTLSDPSPETEVRDEGCLSIPEITCEIARPVGITIRAVGLDGETFELHDDALAARIWQHENDHLDGRLILDQMTAMDRLANRKKLKELEKGGA